MASFITFKGIDQAISNLNYGEKKTLRCRLVDTIRQFYESQGSAESLAGIPTEALVRALWLAGDYPEAMRSRRKNLSSIKYSVNVHLRRLYREGKNPEGIIIGRNNTFVMSDEAKDKLLGAFRNFMKKQGLGALSQIAEIFTLLNELVSSPDTPADKESANGLSGKIRQLKDLVRGLSEKEGSDAEELADFAAEAFMTLSMGKETVGAADTPEVSDEPGDIAQDERSKDKPAERHGEVVQEAELAQAIEALDEDQLEEDED
ncbi:MAG: hypothetical protein JSV40_01295 [Deltaproteobacteria bacterium]|nr:MAG: hypothetical protein JSV40_01295 [Deltaproteobacteria bacterium]